MRLRTRMNLPVHKVAAFESMSDERPERLSDVLTDDKVGDFIEIGRLTVDDDESRAVSFRVKRKSRGRPHHKRRTDRDKEIARGTQLLCTSHFMLRHGLTERYGGSFDVAAAIAIGRATVQASNCCFTHESS